jgi:hypothetical protein
MGRAALGIVVLATLGCADERGTDGTNESVGDADRVAAPAAGRPEPGSADAAVAVIPGYYAAIARGEFAVAHALWADEGAASGQSLDEFRGGFAETRSVEVDAGEPGRIEGAAGSRYIRLPVEVRATLLDGIAQCFRGEYTLRRSEVAGATAQQRLWRIHSADLRPCESGARPEPAARAAAAVERFGERLARVSLLASEATLRQQIRAEYGELVTSSLLDAWLADPSVAPGRRVSSPWPGRIEVRDVRRMPTGAYEVTGDIVHVTSVEVAQGGAARRERVALVVVREPDGRWRINEVTLP